MIKGDLPNPPDSQITAHSQDAEERRDALQQFLNTIPAQIDAIKNKRQEEAVELRRFMMKREKGKNAKR
jgi:hypothetical protein